MPIPFRVVNCHGSHQLITQLNFVLNIRAKKKDKAIRQDPTHNREEKWSVFAQNNVSLCEDIFQRVFVSQILVKKTNIVLLGKGVKKELGFRKSPKMESGAIINPSTPTPAPSNKEQRYLFLTFSSLKNVLNFKTNLPQNGMSSYHKSFG